MELMGIDVSKYQGVIDWNKVKKDGIDFAIIRIGYGKNDNQKDEYFERNYEEAKKAGLKIGVYLYSYAVNTEDAKKEANNLLNWLNGKSLDLPIYYDIEDKTQEKLSKQTLTNICTNFANIVENAGYWVGIYTNKNWFETRMDYKTLEAKYTIWVAQYNKKCSYIGKYDIWQNSSSGKINGVNGDCDTNIMYRDLIGDISKTTKNPSNNIVEYLKNSEYKGNSIVDALNEIGVDSSYSNRKKLAQKNEIINYTGSASQNLKLLELLKKGKLVL